MMAATKLLAVHANTELMSADLLFRKVGRPCTNGSPGFAQSNKHLAVPESRFSNLICLQSKSGFRIFSRQGAQKARKCERTKKPSHTCRAVVQNPQDLALASDEVVLMQKASELRELLQGTSIFLVGMMGSGKTTVGRVLADALGYCFFDSDWVVEQAAGGASVADIFAENGEEAFREAESQAIAHLSTMVRLVVATGGGSVLRKSNWGRMRDGVTVWLNVPVEALAERVAGTGTRTRPKLAHGEAPLQDPYNATLERLSSIFEERQALYTPADAEVSLQEIAAELGGVPPSSVSPARIALQVLLEIETLIKRRQMEDAARRTA